MNYHLFIHLVVRLFTQFIIHSFLLLSNCSSNQILLQMKGEKAFVDVFLNCMEVLCFYCLSLAGLMMITIPKPPINFDP